MSIQRAEVLFDFNPTADVELQLKQGDVVVVNRTDVGDGWWEGEIDGQRGLFPSSFVKMLPPISTGDDEWAEVPNMATPNLSLPLTPQSSSKKEHMQSLLMPTPLTIDGLYDPLKAAELFVRDHTDIRITAGPRWYHKPLNLTIAVKEGRRDATKGVGFRQLKYFEVSTKELKSRVQRKYKHFLWLYDRLADSFPCISLPPPPIKQSGGAQQEFIESRRRGLERFLNRVAKHPVLGCTRILYEFLTAAGDKEWRIGSKHISVMRGVGRPAAAKKLFGAPIYHAVHYPPYNVPMNQLSEIERFSKFNETLEGTVSGLTRTCHSLTATQSEIANCLKGLGKDLQCLARGVEHPQAAFATAKMRKSSHPAVGGALPVGAYSDDDSEEEEDEKKTGAVATIAQWNWREDEHFTRLMAALDELGGKVRQVSKLHHSPQCVEEMVVEGLAEYSAILHTLPLLVKLHEDAMTAYNESKQKGSKKEAEEVREQCDTLNNIILAEFDYFSGVMLGDVHSLVLSLLRAQADYHNKLAKEWEELHSMFQASALPRNAPLKRSTTLPGDKGTPMADSLSDEQRPRAASSGEHGIAEEPAKPPHSNYVNLPMARPYVNLPTHTPTSPPGVYENWKPASPAHKPHVPILPTSPIPPPTILKRTVKSPDHRPSSPPLSPPLLSQGNASDREERIDTGRISVDDTDKQAVNKEKPVPRPRRNYSSSATSSTSSAGDKRADTPDPSDKRADTPDPSDKRADTPDPSDKRADTPDPSDKRTDTPDTSSPELSTPPVEPLQAVSCSQAHSDTRVKPSGEVILVKRSVPGVALVTRQGPSKSFSQTSEFPKVSLKPSRTLPRGAAPPPAVSHGAADDGSELMRKLTQRRHKIDQDLAKKPPAVSAASSNGVVSEGVANYRIHLDNPSTDQNLTKYGIIEDKAGGSFIV